MSIAPSLESIIAKMKKPLVSGGSEAGDALAAANQGPRMNAVAQTPYQPSPGGLSSDIGQSPVSDLLRASTDNQPVAMSPDAKTFADAQSGQQAAAIANLRPASNPGTYRDQATSELGDPEHMAHRGVGGVFKDILSGVGKGIINGQGALRGGVAGGMGEYRKQDLEGRIQQRVGDLAQQASEQDKDLDRGVKSEQLKATIAHRTETESQGRAKIADKTANTKTNQMFKEALAKHLSNNEAMANRGLTEKLLKESDAWIRDPGFADLPAEEKLQMFQQHHRLTQIAQGNTDPVPELAGRDTVSNQMQSRQPDKIFAPNAKTGGFFNAVNSSGAKDIPGVQRAPAPDKSKGNKGGSKKELKPQIRNKRGVMGAPDEDYVVMPDGKGGVVEKLVPRSE